MGDRAPVRVTGPLAPYAAGFEGELARIGYRRDSARRVLNLVAHASRWLASQELGIGDLGPARVEEFCRARRDEGYIRCLSPKALSPLMDYLRRLGVVTQTPPGRPTVVDEVIERYAGYLVAERGAAPATVRTYARIARLFLGQRLCDSGLELDRLTAAHVIAFVSAECPRLAPASAATLTKSLRSLLRFLHVEGLTSTELASFVPGAAGWRLAPLPKAIDTVIVRRLFESCDRLSAAGLRDVAVLTVLARLGLRAGEVAGLDLADIDWRGGEVSVRGKGNRQERLPLPVDVGEAVVDWLRVRPGCESSMVFTSVRAPICGVSAGGVSAIVRRACRRCGLDPLGAHRLRHTVATELLRAGAGLDEIGLVLRHHRLSTTAIYAKVDRVRLAGLAQPWPGGLV